MSSPMLKVTDLNKSFKNGHRSIKAVDDVSFEIHQGRVMGLVGESGSGKSTVARLITHIEHADSGSIVIDGTDFSSPDRAGLRALRSKVQMVFQNAEGSFNPRMKIGDALMESVINFNPGLSHGDAVRLLKDDMALVGLDYSLCSRYPKQLSGGQCQRAAIVRALVANPRILICDEATSALDVLVQARIIELLHEIILRTDMSMLFISHDLALVSSICDDLTIMNSGKCVEKGSTVKVINEPESHYTQTLLDSIL